MQLDQKNIFGSYHLSFNEVELKYKKSSFLHYTQQTIPIDSINLRSYNVTRSVDLVALVIAGCLGIGLLTAVVLLVNGINQNDNGNIIGSVVAFILTGIGSIYWFNLINIKVFISTTAGITIDFLHNKPSHQQVDEFIEQLKKTQKKFFIDRYGSFDVLLPFQDQINNLLWLRNNNFLSHEEYEEKRKIFVTSNEKRIGY